MGEVSQGQAVTVSLQELVDGEYPQNKKSIDTDYGRIEEC